MQRIDLQLLLDLGPAQLGGGDAIADGRQGAVPEALTGVFLQGAQDVLGVLLGLIFVEQRHDLTHHDVHRIVAQLLCHGDEFDAVLGQLADVELQFEVIAEETREAVNHDHVECSRFCRPGLDHPLELGATVVGGRCARFHEGLDKLVAARGAIGLALFALVGDGDIVLGLPRRRDSQVEGGAQRHGHDGDLLDSSARPEQLIEEVAEPCLEHIHLGLADRHALGPIVRDVPGRNVILGRASERRPTAGNDMKIVGQRAEMDAPLTSLAVRGVDSGHPDTIGRRWMKRNRPRLRQRPLRIAGKKYRNAARIGPAGVAAAAVTQPP